MSKYEEDADISCSASGVKYLWKCPRCGNEVWLPYREFELDDVHDAPACGCHPQMIFMRDLSGKAPTREHKRVI